MKIITILQILSLICVITARLGEPIKAETTEILASIALEKDGKWVISEGKFDPKTFVASANYTKGLESLGWDLLAISTNKNFEDEVQAEAAGRLEGYLTKTRIWNHWANLNAKANWPNSTFMPENLQNFFKAQEAYVDELYAANKTDGVAANAYFILRQFRGMIDSYNLNMPVAQQISPVEFHTMASFGDLLDITYYNNTKGVPRFFEMTSQKIQDYFLVNSHCSALFKAKEDFSDIFFGHNSWFYYSAMTRIFKEYNFNFNHASVKSRNILFSSYPATLSSMDDFYVTSQDLVVIETTNAFFNEDLYSKLTPRSLLCWQRAMIANRISVTSREWTENFAKENSGTYNNMFMALDMKKVDTVNKVIEQGALHIIEQLPGFVEINDVTQYLRYGYWPSYNTPFSQKVKELSKIDEIIQNKPELSHSFDYHTCARANIFRRDQGKVHSIDDFKKLIRYNDYQNDPLSLGNPSFAVASRIDLLNKCMGAYDAKASSVTLAKGRNKIINIVQGPTFDNLPAFNWKNSEKCKYDPRFGLPDVFEFHWFQYKNQFVDELVYESEKLEFIE
jgi:hypothetical protein